MAILTSGRSRGSNFEAIIRYIKDNDLPVEVAFVIVTRKNAPIIKKCDAFHIQHILLKTTDIAFFESKLLHYLTINSIDLLVLSGFLFKLSNRFLKAITCPAVNIHPALLPRYGGEGMYGHHVHEAVFSEREKTSGATVHWVNEDYDAGKIIYQLATDITTCNTPEEIAARVLAVEHQIYGPTIWRILNNEFKP